LYIKQLGHPVNKASNCHHSDIDTIVSNETAVNSTMTVGDTLKAT
jgi:hypothetical protein